MVGLLYGIIAAAALLISAAGLRERPEVSSRTAEDSAVADLRRGVEQPSLCPAVC